MQSSALRLRLLWVSMMDKRAAVVFYAYMMAFIRFFVLAFVALALVFFMRQYMTIDIDTSNVETEVFAQSLLYSPHGISTGRPGTLDADDFRNPGATEARLAQAFHFEDENRFIAARLDLIRNSHSYLEPVYYNKKYLDIWEPMARSWLGGKGSATILEKYYQVLVEDNGAQYDALLKMTIVLPNS